MSDALDSLIPEFQFSEHHTAVVLAKPDHVFEAVEAMDITDSTIARVLMRLWRIPARLYSKDVPDRYMSVNDFIPLIRTPPKDLMRGLVGGRSAPKDKSAVDAEAFRAFDEPGCMKLVWGIWLTDLNDDRVRVDTETRVYCTDPKTKRMFMLYWTIIRARGSGGGLCYGYDVVRETDAAGNPVRGKRTINEEEAKVVRSIFRDFANGLSATAIAKRLNAEGVPGPFGGHWGQSTINGNWRRGTGILNNDLYIGRLVWNRQHFVKDPNTGKRQARSNPESEWIVEEIPELRIVPQDLWDMVKERQEKTRRTVTPERSQGTRLERARRPVHLFSSLLKCGQCGGSYSLVSGTRYGCTNRKTKGTCDNKLRIRRTDLEEIILSGLKDELMDPALVKEFIRSYHDRLDGSLADETSRREDLQKQLAKVKKELDALVSAVKAGIQSDTLKDEFERLEKSKRVIEQELAEEPPPVRLHPNLTEIYRQQVENLVQALNGEETRQEAGEIIRRLVDETLHSGTLG